MVFSAVKNKQPSNYLAYLGQHHLQAVTARNGTTHKHLHNVWVCFQMNQLHLGRHQSVRDGQPADYGHLYKHTLRRFYYDALIRKKEMKSYLKITNVTPFIKPPLFFLRSTHFLLMFSPSLTTMHFHQGGLPSTH